MLEHLLTLSDFFQRGWDFLLDFLFPKGEAVREIETAEPEAFATKHVYRGGVVTHGHRPASDPAHIHTPSIYVQRVVVAKHEKRIERRTTRKVG